MRLSLLVALLAVGACSKNNPNSTSQALICDSGETVVYSNRFVPVAGGSGVATGADAVNGAINSDGPSYGGGGVGLSEGDAPRGAPSSSSSTPSSTTSSPI